MGVSAEDGQRGCEVGDLAEVRDCGLAPRFFFLRPIALSCALLRPVALSCTLPLGGPLTARLLTAATAADRRGVAVHGPPALHEAERH